MNLFEKFGLSHELLDSIKKLGFTKPTQIQEKSIPAIMSGKDVTGGSATGSGKTLAFGCGIIEKVVPKKGVQALVLTPTRELAEQVKDSIKELSYKKGLKVISIYGGVAIGPQIHDLTKSEVVIATPGRLLDHSQRKTIDTSKIKILVLDEADRMLDMGFIDDVERIIRNCPKKRQTLFFSATLSPRIKELAKRYMQNPINVSAETFVDPSKLKQVYYNISKNQKLSLLVHLLHNEQEGLDMIFCNTRRNTDFVVKNLKANKIKAIAIHGGLTQNKRTKTIESFNNAKVDVLVCTDVAARGLHIDNVSHIYNYEVPKDSKDYVHRIGRTARAGEEGKVINLLSDYDHDNFSRIQRDYSFSIKKTDIPHLEQITVKKADDDRRGRYGGRRDSRGSSRGRDSGRGSNSGRERRNSSNREIDSRSSVNNRRRRDSGSRTRTGSRSSDNNRRTGRDSDSRGRDSGSRERSSSRGRDSGSRERSSSRGRDSGSRERSSSRGRDSGSRERSSSRGRDSGSRERSSSRGRDSGSRERSSSRGRKQPQRENRSRTR